MSAKRNPEAGILGVPESLTATTPLDCSHSTERCAETRTRPAASDALANVWVLVVQPTDGRYRRRVFLSIEPAWQAARRAEDRGQRADVVLCRLVPMAGECR